MNLTTPSLSRVTEDWQLLHVALNSACANPVFSVFKNAVVTDVSRGKWPRHITGLTDGDQLLALGAVDIGVSVYAAGNERVVRKLRGSIPCLFLLRRLGAEGIISYARLIRVNSQRNSACKHIGTYHQVNGMVLDVLQRLKKW